MINLTLKFVILSYRVNYFNLNIYQKILFRIFSNRKSYTPIKPTYLDRSNNFDALILAPGPTIDTHADNLLNFIKKKDNLKVFSINFHRPEFNIEYITLTNRKRFRQNIDWITSNDLKYLLSPYLNKNLINFLGIKNYELIMFQNNFENIFDIKNGVINTNCRSSAVLTIAICIVMSFQNIYVAGLDGFTNYINLSANIHSKKSVYYSKKSKSIEKEHLIDLDKKNYIKLIEIDNYLKSKNLNKFKIITPTYYEKFYDPIILNEI